MVGKLESGWHLHHPGSCSIFLGDAQNKTIVHGSSPSCLGQKELALQALQWGMQSFHGFRHTWGLAYQPGQRKWGRSTTKVGVEAEVGGSPANLGRFTNTTCRDWRFDKQKNNKPTKWRLNGQTGGLTNEHAKYLELNLTGWRIITLGDFDRKRKSTNQDFSIAGVDGQSLRQNQWKSHIHRLTSFRSNVTKGAALESRAQGLDPALRLLKKGHGAINDGDFNAAKPKWPTIFQGGPFQGLSFLPPGIR